MDIDDKSSCIVSCIEKSGSAAEYQQPSYLKVDGNKVVNENHIRWVERLHDCMYICMKSNDVQSVCKGNNTETFDLLNNKFETKPKN